MRLVSAGTRLLAALTKATNRPSGLIAALRETSLANQPLELTLTRTVVRLIKSRTKMSDTLLVSPGTRSLAALSKRAKRPLVEIPTGNELALPPVPVRLTLTRVVVALVRSRRKTLRCAGTVAEAEVLSTRLFAALANST